MLNMYFSIERFPLRKKKSGAYSFVTIHFLQYCIQMKNVEMIETKKKKNIYILFDKNDCVSLNVSKMYREQSIIFVV